MRSYLVGHKRLVATVVVTVLVLLGAGGYAYAQSNRLPSDAAFKYAGTVVTVSDLDNRVQVLSALYGVTRPSGPPAKIAEFDRAAAKSLAVSMILDRAARARDIVISDKQAADALDNLIADQLAGGRAAFVQFLGAHNISESDVLAEIKRQLATSKLAAYVTRDTPKISQARTRAFYDAHQAQMKSPESRKLLNIVVSSKTSAERVLRLAAKQDFAALARTWSQDGSTRAKGGDLGFVTADQLDPAYAHAAFTAPSGALFGPVQTKYGWNVGKVAAVRVPVQLSYLQVSTALTGQLLSEAKLVVWRDYLGELLKHAGVEYAAAYRPADPTAAPTDLPTGTAQSR